MNHFQTKAIHEASKSTHALFHVGAVLVVRNMVVSHGFNLSMPGFCAERRALRNAPRIALRGGGDVYVARVLKSGTLTMAKPCLRCVEALKKARVRRIYFTTWLGIWSKLTLS